MYYSCIIMSSRGGSCTTFKAFRGFFFVCASVSLAPLFQGDVTSQLSQVGQFVNQLIIKSQLMFHPLIWLLSVIKWTKYFLELWRWTGESMKREHQFKIPWGRECFFFFFFLCFTVSRWWSRHPLTAREGKMLGFYRCHHLNRNFWTKK